MTIILTLSCVIGAAVIILIALGLCCSAAQADEMMDKAIAEMRKK
jgi:hypothetical protein